jgi:hypothetical protein
MGTVQVVDEDFYNTDGYGLILIVEREDHRFAEAANGEGPFAGAPAEAAILPGTEWQASPNAVIEAWFRARSAEGEGRRPNQSA